LIKTAGFHVNQEVTPLHHFSYKDHIGKHKGRGKHDVQLSSFGKGTVTSGLEIPFCPWLYGLASHNERSEWSEARPAIRSGLASWAIWPSHDFVSKRNRGDNTNDPEPS
jgi:hypothetical protein